jgi:hypothetical protein
VYFLGLWAALDQSNPDRGTVERLLKNWCRMTCVKDGKVVSIKSLVRDDIHKRDLLEMIERFENPNEMALALSAGFGFIVKGWVKQGKTSSGVNYTVDTNLSYKHDKL